MLLEYHASDLKLSALVQNSVILPDCRMWQHSIHSLLGCLHSPTYNHFCDITLSCLCSVLTRQRKLVLRKCSHCSHFNRY